MAVSTGYASGPQALETLKAASRLQQPRLLGQSGLIQLPGILFFPRVSSLGPQLGNRQLSHLLLSRHPSSHALQTPTVCSILIFKHAPWGSAFASTRCVRRGLRLLIPQLPPRMWLNRQIQRHNFHALSTQTAFSIPIFRHALWDFAFALISYAKKRFNLRHARQILTAQEARSANQAYALTLQHNKAAR